MLYIVSTPIGNLEDISLRAINILSNCDLILAEDTRVTRVLLERYNIKKSLLSYHEHSDEKKIGQIIGELRDGKNIALVTDAGTPGICDPGNFLIAKILEAMPELKVVPIPGANAAITALSISGFPTDKFIFLGFPPHKKGRQTFFKRIKDMEETVVFYESKHRIMKALADLKLFSEIGDRKIMVARELTKQFETVYRGTLEEVTRELSRGNVLGEFVIIISRK